jgi:hypothetical protein
MVRRKLSSRSTVAIGVLADALTATLPAERYRVQPTRFDRRLPRVDREAQAKTREGRLLDAVPIREAMLRGALRLFGPDHVNTAASMFDLGYLYDQIGAYGSVEDSIRARSKSSASGSALPTGR